MTNFMPHYKDLIVDPELKTIVSMFLKNTENYIVQIKGYFHRSDWQGLRVAAEELRTSASSFGFPTIYEAAQTIEMKSRLNKVSEIDIDHLLQACLKMCDEFKD